MSMPELPAVGKAVSSLCRGPFLARQFYGLSFRFQLLSTPRRHDAVTFNLWREAPPQRDFHPPMHAPSQARGRGMSYYPLSEEHLGFIAFQGVTPCSTRQPPTSGAAKALPPASRK